MSNLSAASLTPEPVLTVSQDRDIVTAIERFDAPVDQQVEAIRKATDHIVQQWKADSAFVGAILLRSRDHGGVSCYAQWKRAADGSAPTAPAASRSLAAALPNFKLVDSRTYTVEFTAQAESVTLPTRVSLKQTPIAHFGIFDVTGKSQDVMLDRARENAPKSLGTPGLLAINFHRSIDGLQVLNLGAWSTLGGFKALLQRPGFKKQDEYFKNISEFTYDFFDVVAVEVSQ
jgi:hypothetical protein